MMGNKRKTARNRLRARIFFLMIFAVIALGAAFFILPDFFTTTYEASEESASVLASIEKAKHIKTPVPVKAIYMTSCVVGTPNFRNQLVTLIEETELNSVIIDIKDYTGQLSFIPKNESLAPFVSNKCRADDMEAFIEKLHEKNIYVIGRITVFQDPFLAKLRPDLAVKKKSDGTTWKDYKGISFTDPGSKEVWDHAVAIAKESYEIGFDELNFDYIRFPSDGPMSDIAFSWSGNRKKSDVLEDFFIYLSQNVRSMGAVTSADVFGMTTTNTDDLNIGQILEKIVPHFDYVAPMVYPSHYPPNFNGYANPNLYPYEIIKYSMDVAVRRLVATTTTVALNNVIPIASTTPALYPKSFQSPEKLRPWLQDFDYGGNYDVEEVKAQIQATYDAGLTSWMLWAPSNIYTRGALLPEKAE